MPAPPPSLTGLQRRHLRGLAHGLDPVVRLGQKGLTAGVLREADRALDDHELIKVRLAGDRDERAATAATLAARLRAAAVGTVGSVVILYRRHPDPDARSIELPRARRKETP